MSSQEEKKDVLRLSADRRSNILVSEHRRAATLSAGKGQQPVAVGRNAAAAGLRQIWNPRIISAPTLV